MCYTIGMEMKFMLDKKRGLYVPQDAKLSTVEFGFRAPKSAVAQSVERFPHKEEVTGSSPVRPTHPPSTRRSPEMKKLLLLAVAAGAAVLAKKKLDQGRQEQALWQQATDTVEPR